jgi:O-antigen ligase
LAQAFIIAYYLRLKNLGANWWTWMLPIMLCCILVLQHRSVWVITMISAILIYVLMPENRKKIKKQFLVGAMVSSVLLSPLIVTGKLDVISNSLEHSVEEAGSEKSTFMWRMQSAYELLNDWANSGAVVLLVGKPFGSGYERYVKAQNDAKVNVNPHNNYVLTILRGGSIGLISMVLVYFIAVRKFMSRKFVEREVVETQLLAILLIGQMLFYMTYQAPEIQFVIIGLALTLGAAMPSRKVKMAGYALRNTKQGIRD